MPLDDGTGYSWVTPHKQAAFAQIVQTHLRIAGSITRRWGLHPEYLYFDLTAGPGVVNGAPGSPVLFLEAAATAGVPVRAFLFEEKPALLARLEVAVRRLALPSTCRVRIIPGDHRQTVIPIAAELGSIRGRANGLIYADPNATVPPLPLGPLQTLLSIPAVGPRVDVLANVAANTYKRQNGAFQRGMDLEADLRAIGKRYSWIRGALPSDTWQWAFFILSNWENFPEFRRLGFAPLASAAGQAMLRRLTLTRAERQEAARELQLPFPALSRITAMPPTSGIRGSAKSGRRSSAAQPDAANAAEPGRRQSRTT